ncbi:MAG: hypothetical protein IPG93_21950 [Burkholderiales bacterium]|jgi:hypothetical protein|nr:hypothetical protein [Burkholderiales bacterium]
MATQKPTPAAAGPRIDVKTIANDAGVAVEAYDTYDSDEETLAAAHRFAAGLLNRVAQICEGQPGAKTMDAAALRKLAASLAPK